MVKLLFGVGIYDSKEPTKRTENGITIWRNPYYTLWRNMLQRCYYSDSQEKFPTYQGVKVVDEWLYYSNFVKWLKDQPQHDSWLHGKNMTLDKDIIQGYSRIYSPYTTVLVPQWLNKLLTESKASRGKLPLGVSFSTDGKRYRARVSKNSENLYLGLFDSPVQAHAAWQKAKAEIIENSVAEYDQQSECDLRVVDSLKRIALKLKKDFETGVQTVNYDWRGYE